ncbi:MAG TPA: undecaprenyl-phosphate glucose phosphotransferase [Thermomicrobiales bacterium]|nr:undecaprenyl-phosphate glucose phosphotransferase [Thermomicrobiales bacterium]
MHPPASPLRGLSEQTYAADWRGVLGRAAMKRWLNLLVVVSRAAVDLAMIVAAFLLAYRLRASIDLFSTFVEPSGSTYGLMLGVVVLVLLATFALAGLYSLRRGVSKVDQFYRVASAVSIGLVLSIAANSILLGEKFNYSRQMLLTGWVLCIGLVTVGRLAHGELAGLLRQREAARDRLLIVGADKTGQLILQTIRRSPWLGYEVVGFLTHDAPDAAGPPPAEIDGVPVLGDAAHLARCARAYSIDEVIVALAGTPHEEVLALAQQVIDQPVNIKVYPDTFQLITNNELSLDDLGGLPMVSVRNVALRGWNRGVKRVMDVILSAVILVLAAPVLLALALLVKLTSRGPAFFVQERVGRDNLPFLCIKLRSMPVDAEDATGPVWATPDDPRPTPLGRFMRRYSLDELPQFINVLLGEMSIVGPRPERPHFVAQFSEAIPHYRYRHHEKAGITGWAQVNGLRGDTSIEERTRYDLYYIENWSPLFDLKIIAKTVWLVLRGDPHAY